MVWLRGDGVFDIDLKQLGNISGRRGHGAPASRGPDNATNFGYRNLLLRLEVGWKPAEAEALRALRDDVLALLE